jgi:molybdopterin synthase sulfur carrier subunit
MSRQYRHYVFDDQEQLRQYVQIFVDGKLIRDRDRLSDAVAEAGEVSILQALSGG